MATAEEPPHTRAPPPTPIATGKGLRSAAVDDKVLAEFLETLRVPDLTLPNSVAAAWPSSNGQAPAAVDLPFLIAGHEATVRRMVASAAVVGAFRIDGKGVVPPEELRLAVEMGGAVFRIPDARKREMSGCFGRREGIGEEFYWDWRRSAEIETILQEVWPRGYRTFRERMENIASKMEMIAQCIQKNLSKHVKNQQHASGTRKMKSLLCLRKCENRHFEGDWSECDAAKHCHSHALILHLYVDNDKYSIHCPECSDSLGMPPGSVLVTVGEQVQELCSSGFKSANEETIPELSDNPKPPGSQSLKLACSSILPSHDTHVTIKAITIKDQIMIMLVLLLLCRLWT